MKKKKKKKKKEIFNFQIDLRISIRLYVQKKKIPSHQNITELINKLKTYIP